MNTKKAGVYAITNKLNNKSYVGTAHDLYRAIEMHKNSKFKCDIDKAIEENGIENFEFEILEEWDAMKDKEMQRRRLNGHKLNYMLEYDSIKPFGYNNDRVSNYEFIAQECLFF